MHVNSDIAVSIYEFVNEDGQHQSTLGTDVYMGT